MNYNLSGRFLFGVIISVAAVMSGCKVADNNSLTPCVKDGRIVVGDQPQYFVGTNMWYASDLAISDPERYAAELDTLKALGITNLRILATHENWDGLDAALAALGERGMRAVLFLNNAWEWSPDGYASYLEQAGAGAQPRPATDGYWPYMCAMAEFAKNDKAVELYQDHVRRIVTRYKDSDAIFSWQICNEPRPFSKESAAVDAFVKYQHSTAALIKSIDPRHMVSTGNEGAMGCNDGDYELVKRLNSCPDIDYITVHIWPYNWSWISEDDVQGGLKAAISRTENYINSHLDIARRLGKPVVIEEFGYPRDGFKFSRDASTEGRNGYYDYVFSRVLHSARIGDVLAGCNFWAWSGFARQTPGHDFWQEGDDLCGDPFQEAQGLNGVYLSDESTVAIAREYADSLANTVSVWAPVEHDWMFFGNKPVKLNVKLSGNASEGKAGLALRRDLDLMDLEAGNLLETEKTVALKPGKTASVSFNLGRLEPGFYQVKLNGIKSFNIGVNPEKIESPADAPEDFDEFWQTTLSELAEVPMEVKWTLLPEHSSAKRECYRVEMPSWGGATMGGIIYIPAGEGPYPVRMNFMGYGADVYYDDPDWNADRIDYTVSVRDQGIFKENQNWWIDRGLDSKENFYYRGAFCDIVRSVEFAASLPKADTTRIFGCGDSQGGAFTWISAALTDKMRAIVPSVPFLSDYPDYARIVWWPMHEVFQHADAEGIDRAALMDMLRYFDIKNFTPCITCPVFMAFGLQDPVCPPHTNFAGYNNVRSEKQYMCVPLCGHAMWAEPEFNKARDDYFRKF